MSRAYHTFPVNNNVLIKQQVLHWANQFDICCFFDNHQYSAAYSSFECLIGAGCIKKFTPSPDFFASLSAFIKNNDDWLFGHFNYDIKNKIEESLSSENTDRTVFPEYMLFVPEVVLQLTQNQLIIGVLSGNAENIFNEIIHFPVVKTSPSNVEFFPAINRLNYIETVEKLIAHIKKGDCYEINFCQEFFAQGKIDPVSVYQQLNTISPNPFSAFYKLNDAFLLCASPERFVKKEGDKIISQPIKGTVARSYDSSEVDFDNKNQLLQSSKERSENVMIVDLVRNDLSKICAQGSVKVEELFGIYTFPNVHQMISTVTGTLNPGVGFAEVMQAAFPMGSMTGAPKQKVMELIEKYEQSKRGIYSGTIGYITPDKNFDFNVVIRSLVYNNSLSQLSFHVGSAITANSQPKEEYEECLLKGSAIMQLFKNDNEK